MKSDDFTKSVIPFLKQNGFRKERSTWRKDQGESIAVFNVQKSQWDRDIFYINIGLYYKALGMESSPTENRCHLRKRMCIEEPESIVNDAISWFSAAVSMQDARQLVRNEPKDCFIVKELRGQNVT
jgi:hypothetical protein